MDYDVFLLIYDIVWPISIVFASVGLVIVGSARIEWKNRKVAKIVGWISLVIGIMVFAGTFIMRITVLTQLSLMQLDISNAETVSYELQKEYIPDGGKFFLQDMVNEDKVLVSSEQWIIEIPEEKYELLQGEYKVEEYKETAIYRYWFVTTEKEETYYKIYMQDW